MEELQKKIIDLLKTVGKPLSLQAIAKGLNEKDNDVLKALNRIDRRKVDLIVIPLDENNSTSTLYKSI